MLVAGHRIGTYEIVSLLGVGGMGQVYRARDTRLGRDVAIKILPPAFTTDPDRLVRFEREARLLASLNHANVAAIYGIEDNGDTRALILELVEGETLADRIARGPLPAPEAQRLAQQIAEALDAAHERGIVHRDLKPANIKLTPDGVVKVLDFGLAKDASGDVFQLAQSPTITVAGTRGGIILGTAAYMSPEQARGRAVDKRADIWAFGCVLFEMLTGKAAFAGETTTDILAAIVDREPHWDRLPASTPASLRRVLGRCLEKDLKRRLRDIGDLRGELDAHDAVTPVDASRRWRVSPVVVITAVAGALLIGAAAGVWTSESRAPVGRLHATALTRLTWDGGFTTQPSISADGRLVAYASDRAGQGNLDIWVQQVAGGQAIRLTSDPTDDSDPEVSPDGSLIAFRSERQPEGVYVVPALGGTARLIVPGGREPKFSPDGRQIAAWLGGWLAARSVGLVRQVVVASASGGDVKQIETGLASAGDPVWSPDGTSLLVFGRRATTGPNIDTDWWVISPSGGPPLRTNTFARLEAAGIDTSATDDQPYPSAWTDAGVFFVARLLNADAKSTWQIALDAKTKQAADPVAITTGTAQDDSPSVSRDGRLVVASLNRDAALLMLPLDPNAGRPSGKITHARDTSAFTGRASLSQDGRLLAFVQRLLGTSELWIRDMKTGGERQLVVTPPAPLNPVLSPDGTWVGYTVTLVPEGGDAGAGTAYMIPAGGGVPRKVCDACELYNWTPDNRRVFVVSGSPRAIQVVDVMTGATETLTSELDQIDRPMLSPNRKLLSINGGTRSFVAALDGERVPPRAQWHDMAPDDRGRAAGWSPDGRLVYLLLERDGSRCLYARPVDPDSGRPAGEIFPVYHFHDARLRWGSTGYSSAVVEGVFLSDQYEFHGNVWMTTISR